ncbi:MAG: ATP-binding cassette domain-containing protein, partial [Clostridia bacterium]|nr:ATP-binding cassette domain-containing protein [Clostridia bacterium]
SGGQQQRVALARILVNQPELLLLDEPFSALDSHLRFQLEQEVRNTIRRFGKTVILVSHNRDEVFRLSDGIAIMNDGHIEAIGDKKSVFANPQTRNGAILTGCKNVSPIEKRGDRLVYATAWGIALNTASPVGDAKYIGIRMHDIRSGQVEENAFLCDVVEEIENPFSSTVMLRPQGADGTVPLGWELNKDAWGSQRAAAVKVCLPPQSILLLKE